MPYTERPISIAMLPLLEGESDLLENYSQSRIQRVDTLPPVNLFVTKVNPSFSTILRAS